MAGSTPKNGRVHEPGLVAVMPGSGVIRIEPVSVCHQVSTIGQRSWPITRWYHIQACGLIGSPTEPRSRKDDRSKRAGCSSLKRMNVRIAECAVYRIDILWHCILYTSR